MRIGLVTPDCRPGDLGHVRPVLPHAGVGAGACGTRGPRARAGRHGGPESMGVTLHTYLPSAPAWPGTPRGLDEFGGTYADSFRMADRLERFVAETGVDIVECPDHLGPAGFFLYRRRCDARGAAMRPGGGRPAPPSRRDRVPRRGGHLVAAELHAAVRRGPGHPAGRRGDRAQPLDRAANSIAAPTSARPPRRLSTPRATAAGARARARRPARDCLRRHAGETRGRRPAASGARIASGRRTPPSA